jgi:hypothetical protein
VVALTSSNAAVTVPASVAVAAGSASASFTAQAGTVSSTQAVTVTATFNGASKTAALSVSTGDNLTTGLAGYWNLDQGAGTTVIDNSGNGNIGIFGGSPVWTGGKTGGALSFDGVDDFVDAGNDPMLSPSNAITLSAWVNLKSTSGTYMIVSKYNVSAQYFLRVNSGRVRFNVNTGGVLSGPPDSTVVLAPNTWYHITATYDGSQAKVYINGVQNTAVAKTGTMVNNGVHVNIGRQGKGMYWKGLLDEVRVYNRALTATEVQTLYANPAQP